MVPHQRPTEPSRSPTPEPAPQPAGAAAVPDASGAAAGSAAQAGEARGGPSQPLASGRIDAGAFSDAGPDASRSRRCLLPSSLLILAFLWCLLSV